MIKKKSSSFLSVLLFRSDFKDAKIKNLKPLEFPEGVFSVISPKKQAVLESGIYKTPFPFNELLLSANVILGGNNEGSFELEAKILTGKSWSKWLSFGCFSTSAVKRGSAKNQKDGSILIDTDILKTKIPAEGLKFRIKINAGKGAALRLVSFTATDASLKYSAWRGSRKSLQTKILPIPPASQFTQPTDRAGRICSPVCCCMALNEAGITVSAADFEKITHDETADICGNWFLNTAGCGAAGAYAFTTRLNSIEEAKALIEKGIPICASLTFGENELPGFYLKKTAGHFMLIKGFNENGDIAVNDPASPSDAEAEKIYPFRAFEKAWLGTKRGLCYVITSNIGALLNVRASVSELYRKPPLSGTEKEKKELIETQLLFNEPVEAIKTSGEWAFIRTLEQKSETQCGLKLLPHYEGWIKAEDLRLGIAANPSHIVSRKKIMANGIISGPASQPLQEKTSLSLGTKLPYPIPGKTRKIEKISKENISSLRKNILETAKTFLGDPYVWGGRSAWGIDCSGLANISYRAWGINLPRNAHGQFLASETIEPESLKPADLMFLSDTFMPNRIGHVMLYLGEGKIIEATQSTNNVRIVSCEEKFGIPFSKLHNGTVLPNGKSFHCGTVFTKHFFKHGRLSEPGNRVIRNAPNKNKPPIPGNKAEEIIKVLKKEYPNAGCELNHKNVFELLAATILSAQCTDERVNKITPILFSSFPDAAAMAAAPIEKIEEIIRPTGFFRSKALSLKEASRSIMENYGGEIPKDKAKLMTLRGVAGKTANVILGTGYGIAGGIVVDTHVKRLAFRLGLTEETDPEKIEQGLIKIIPQSEWIWFSHALILHGRGPCDARKPLCAECHLATICPKMGIKMK